MKNRDREPDHQIIVGALVIVVAVVVGMLAMKMIDVLERLVP